MTNVLYPLKFKPIFKDKIWGGRKIKDIVGLDYGQLPNCGEAWLLSGLWDEQSVVTNGDFIPAGTRLRVTLVEGARVVVEAAPKEE